MTSKVRHSSYVKKKSEPLIRDLFLEPASTSSMSAQLTIDFIKFLCFQKGQIPVTCNQIESHLCSVMKEMNNNIDLSSLRSREKMAVMKNRRNKLNFIKKASQFLKDIREMCTVVNNRFLVSQKQIAIIVGTSIFNPKEAYVLDFTHWKDSNHDSNIEETRNLKRNLSTFFRDLVISEDLFSLLQPVKPTSISVLLNSSSKCSLEDGDCVPRLNYRIPLRGKQMVMRILPKTTINHPLPSLVNCSRFVGPSDKDTVSRKLVFNSPRPGHGRTFDKSEGLDISGIAQLDDDVDPLEDSLIETIPEETFCWFQVRCVLRGFACKI